MSLVEYFDAHLGTFYLCVLALGLLVGSFLNVVIHRLPLMMERQWRTQCSELLHPSADGPQEQSTTPERPFNLVLPRSRCPNCEATVKAWHNIPVLSYIALRGRCAHCAWPIPLRYPTVELLGGLLSSLAAVHFGPTVVLAGVLLLIWGLIALCFIDFDTQLLPDSITLPLLWLGIAVNIQGGIVDLRSSVIGAMAGYLVLWGVYHGFKILTGKEGMGYGDFKLLALIGAWLGWKMLPLVVLGSSFAGAIVGVTLVAFGKHDRQSPMPFGPFLVIAGLVALFWGEPITTAYLDSIRPPASPY